MRTKRTELNVRNHIELFIIKARPHPDKSDNEETASSGLLGSLLTLIIQNLMYRGRKEEEELR